MLARNVGRCATISDSATTTAGGALPNPLWAVPRQDFPARRALARKRARPSGSTSRLTAVADSASIPIASLRLLGAVQRARRLRLSVSHCSIPPLLDDRLARAKTLARRRAAPAASRRWLVATCRRSPIAQALTLDPTSAVDRSLLALREGPGAGSLEQFTLAAVASAACHPCWDLNPRGSQRDAVFLGCLTRVHIARRLEAACTRPATDGPSAAAAVPDLNLRVAEMLAELHLPA